MSQSNSSSSDSAKIADLSQGQRPTNVRWLIFALACSSSFILYLHRYTWGIMKAEIASEFDWDPAQLGMLDSCFSLSYALGQIPFGILGDWFGPAAVLGSTIGLWSLAMGATALAGGLSSMFLARFAFGITQAGCYSNLSKITKVWFPITIRTTVQGWVASFFGRSGGAMSYIFFGSILIGTFGLPWRVAIGLMTLLGLVFAAVFIYLFRNTPAEHPWANQAEADLIAADDPNAGVASRTKLKWSTALRSGNMRIFLFQQFTSAFADNLYVYWIPIFLIVQKGVDIKGAGLLAALPLLGGAFGGMVGGSLQNMLILKTGKRRWVRSSIGCIGKMLAAVFMFISLGFDSAMIISVLFVAVKFFGDWSQPTVWGTVTDIGGRNSASVFSLVNTVGSIAGFTAGPTMGVLILFFSQNFAVEQESPAAIILPSESETSIRFTRHMLDHKAVVAKSISGTLADAGKEVARFTVNKKKVFTFEILDNSAVKPLANKSKLNSNKSELTIAWETLPTQPAMQLDYQYTKYGSGWTALFIVMGVVYVASSLSWLFIDCTKTLENSTSS